MDKISAKGIYEKCSCYFRTIKLYHKSLKKSTKKLHKNAFFSGDFGLLTDLIRLLAKGA